MCATTKVPASPRFPRHCQMNGWLTSGLEDDTVAMAIELEDLGIKVSAVSPGHTRMRLTGFSGPDSVEEGAAEAVRVALLGADAPTGTFTHATLGRLPW